MKNALSSDAKWYQTRAAEFNPDENSLMTQDGREISYDFLVLAPGLQLRFDLVRLGKYIERSIVSITFVYYTNVFID